MGSTKQQERCGAKTRSGTPCKHPAGFGTDHLGTGRCKFHGGCSTGTPKGARRAWKHGIYSRALRPDEEEIWPEIPVGELDDEIRVAKLQLKRAMEEFLKVEIERAEDVDTVEGMELAETKHEQGVGAKGPIDIVSVTKKRPDYRAHIDRCLARIGKLEQVRAQMGGKQNDDETAEQLARKIRQAVQDIDTDENEYNVE